MEEGRERGGRRQGGREQRREERKKSKPLDNSLCLPLVLLSETLSRVVQAGLSSVAPASTDYRLAPPCLLFFGAMEGTKDFPHARQALWPLSSSSSPSSDSSGLDGWKRVHFHNVIIPAPRHASGKVHA